MIPDRWSIAMRSFTNNGTIMKEPRWLTSSSVRMDGGEIKGIKGAVTTKLTPSDEA
jgi:hypothetical protein